MKRIMLLPVLALFFMVAPTKAESAYINLSVSTSGKTVFVQARVPRRRYFLAANKGWSFYARVWVRDAHSWRLVKQGQLYRRKWLRSLRKASICVGSFGKKRVAVQLGLKSGSYWWDRLHKRWNTTFITYRQSIQYVFCAANNTDTPPGSLYRAYRRAPHHQLPWNVTPPPRNTAPPTGGNHHGGNHHGGNHHGGNHHGGSHHGGSHHGGNHHGGHHPTHPPAPVIQIVPSTTFSNFLQSVRSISYDSKRVSTIKNWVSRLGKYKLSPWQVKKMAKIFSYDSYRLKAIQTMARHMIKPKARQVGSAIGSFSYDSYRAQAAQALCRQGLVDPLNIFKITAKFSYSSYKAQVRKHCK